MTVGRAKGDHYQAAWLCYINGLEIPVMGIETNFSVWQIPSCAIHLIPHPMIERIGQEDRLQVVLFYLDEFIDPTNPQFRCLGEFEVIGWSYSSTPLGRAITINCGSHLQIFKQLFFANLSAYQDKVIKKYSGMVIYEQGEIEFFGPPVETADVDMELDTILATDASTVKKNVTTETTEVKRVSQIKRPIDLILHIFRSILSPVNAPKVKKQPKQTAQAAADKAAAYQAAYQAMGLEDPPKTTSQKHTSVIKKNFFARWLKMTGFHKRWIALPLFEEDIISGGVFPIIKETGGQKALTALNKYAGPRGGSAWDMLMQVLIPMYMELIATPSPPSVSVAKNLGKILGKKPKGTSEFHGLATFYIKPQCVFSLVPMCNVMFTSMVDSINFTESYIDQPTRVKLQMGRGSALASIISSGMGSLFKSIVQRELAGGFPWVVQKRLQQYLGAPGSNSDNFLIFPEELYKGPVIKDLGVPPWLLRIQKAYSGTPNKSSPENWNKVTDKEMIDYYTKYSKRTRADILATKNTYEWEKLARDYLVDKRNVQADIDAAIVTLPDTQTETTSKDSDKALTVPKGAQALIAKYIQYEFFKARYEQRSATVNLVGFNPYIVPGFPGIGFDGIEAGMHMIGYVVGVMHTWSAQSGGPAMTTNVTLMYARTLTEHLRDNVPEPLTTVGKIFQNSDNAKKFYTKLFFGTEDPGKRVLYDPDNTLTPKDPVYQTSKPTPEYEDVFSNYGDAMRLVARPGCTLIEYVELWHNKDIKTLEREDVLRGKRTSFYSSLRDPTPESGLGGAIFWDRIYKLKQGPGDDPGAKVTNIQKGKNANAGGMGKTGWKPVDDTHGNMAQTRNDWDTILELYRKIIYSEDGFLAPQE